jgi:hypothetical protein
MGMNFGSPVQFMNGFTPGRVAYNQFGHALFGVFHSMWNNPKFKFQSPSTLEQIAAVYKLQMEAVCVLSAESSYSSPYIGVPMQLKTIQQPKRRDYSQLMEFASVGGAASHTDR